MREESPPNLAKACKPSQTLANAEAEVFVLCILAAACDCLAKCNAFQNPASNLDELGFRCLNFLSKPLIGAVHVIAINKGMIYSTEHGSLNFTVLRFVQYMRRNV
jgi:hypothetical protein